MYGADMGDLLLYTATHYGQPDTMWWVKRGDQGHGWKKATVTLHSDQDFQVRNDDLFSFCVPNNDVWVSETWGRLSGIEDFSCRMNDHYSSVLIQLASGSTSEMIYNLGI